MTSTPTNLPPNDLTREEEARLLTAIDAAGADAWNEGEYQWIAKTASVDFAGGRCWITFDVAEPGDDPEKPKRRWYRTGSIEGIHAFADLLDNRGFLTIATFDKMEELTGAIHIELHSRYGAPAA